MDRNLPEFCAKQYQESTRRFGKKFQRGCTPVRFVSTCSVLALAAMPSALQAQFAYTTNNGAITITGYHGLVGPVSIPSTVNGMPVVEIGDYAFIASPLTSVTIPIGITNIGNWSFQYCTNISRVVLPNSALHIGDGVFADCTSLSIVSIADGVTSIGSDGFAGCLQLYNISIPQSVTSIGERCFQGCTNLVNISVDPLNSCYSSLDGVLFDKFQTNLLKCPEGKIGNYKIPDTVNAITDFSFSDCTELTGVSIPYGVRSIGYNAFSYCGRLASVTLPASVTNIGEWAFQNCISLTDLTVPDSLVTISYGALGGCAGLTNLTISQGVRNIGDYSFAGCSNLRSVEIPSSVTNIGTSAFSYCQNLADLTLSEGIRFIGDFAFSSCLHLVSVKVPSTVTNIGYYTFSDCPALADITVDVLNVSYRSEAGVLFDSSQSRLLVYPPAKVGGYSVPGSVRSIEHSAFQDCANLTSISLPGGITNIGPYAFYSTGLTSITIPASVIAIGYLGFSYCGRLAGLYFEGGPSSIGSSAFDGDTATVYYLPGTVGWGSTFGGLRTARWTLPYPLILTQGPNFGLQNKVFGFVVSWATNRAVVVEGSTDLPKGPWQPLKTNTLETGWFYFSDISLTNYPARFYRVHSF